MMTLIGVLAATRTLPKPASVRMLVSRAVPAWLPRPRWPSWASEPGMQMAVDAA